jgi:hypothetical protein
MGGCMGFAVYYQDGGRWTWSDTPPWDSRPTADNIWAAFTAAEWASQQKLDWSHRARVFDVLKKKDAEVARRDRARGTSDLAMASALFGRGGVTAL